MPDGRREERSSLWSMVDDRLRGRWRAAIVVSLLLATVFSLAGYRRSTPEYLSGGLIRIAPSISPILRDTPETGVLPLYRNFVETHVRLIQSRSVLERALRSDTLADLPWAQSPNAVQRLGRGLSVTADRGSELIAVQFRDHQPDVAQAAVNAVLAAYDDLYGSVGSDEISRKVATLRQKQTELS